MVPIIQHSSRIRYTPYRYPRIASLEGESATRCRSFSAIAFSAYIFSKLSHFIGNNSFADGACSDVCESNSFAETNLATITGRNDGTLTLQDSPIDETILLSQIDPPDDLSPFEIEQWTISCDYPEKQFLAQYDEYRDLNW